jgi:antitoxin Phd
MQIWQMQEAKAQLAEVVRRANEEGPQEITIHNRPAAVVISFEEYQQRFNAPESTESLLDFLRASPLCGADLDLERDRSLPREIDL